MAVPLHFSSLFKREKGGKRLKKKGMEMKTDKDRFLNSAHCVYLIFMNGIFWKWTVKKQGQVKYILS